MHRLLVVSLAAALMLVGSTTPAWAQRNTATFEGIVVDNTGGILPGVDVALTNEGTGIVERQVTGATGEFQFNYVLGGSYTLVVSIAGFRTQTVKGISVGAAQNIRRRLEMELGDIAENITVSGAAPLINTVSAEQRVSLETTELASLPTANRNITNLLNIGAGLTRQEAQVEGGGAGGSAAGTVRLRLNGLGGSAMSITANGTEASGTAGTRSISTYNGVSKIDVVSIESVGEVNIVKGIMPAEFGNAMAGNLNIITKAGSNVWHGSLFDRYEGAGLVAKPFFLKEKPTSTWNQGGGSLGGRLVRDRVFFFTAFEAYRLERALEINTNVPTQRFRDLLTTSMPSPEIRLLLAQYPLPTEPVSATALTGTFIGPGSKENNDDHLDLRGDVRLMGGNLQTTFTYGHPFLNQASTLPGLPVVFDTSNRRATASYALTKARWSSETRFGYSYNYLSRIAPGVNLLDPVHPGPLEPATGPNRRMLPTITFPGLQLIGSEGHIRGQRPSYSFEQQLTLVTDNHAFKFGGRYAAPRGGRANVQDANFAYLTEADIVANRPTGATFRPVSIDARWASTNWGFFVQDDWRLHPKLVLNLGVRYDYFGRFKVEGLDPTHPAGFVNLDGEPDPSFTFGAPRSPDRIVEDDKGINVGPRIGFAYNPDGNGNAVVSGGWGLMFQSMDPQVFESLQIGTTSGIPSNKTYSAVELAALGLKYPLYNEDIARLLEATLVPGPFSSVGNLMDPHLQTPYAHVFTVGLQRAFGSATVVNAAYLGTRGHNFRMNRRFNLPDRLTGIRPNLKLDEGTYLDDSGEAKYHSLQTSIRQRLSGNLQFNLNYTWSSTRANYDGDNAGGSVNDEIRNIQEFFDIDSNWGPAIGDVRHNFIGDVIYQTPGADWASPVAKHLLGGWQVAAIFRARTGEPITIVQSGRDIQLVARPDILDPANAINKDCCDIGSNNLQYLNPAAFQLVPIGAVSRQAIRAGTVGNGQFRAPGLKNIDVSLAKSFNVGGPRRVELRADVLNALNWVNYIAVSVNRSASNFGRITGVAAARVAQLQARFSF
jgi:Carboxypeptidase regulatory-like domain/TonB dependent receptor-like, beta-barrel